MRTAWVKMTMEGWCQVLVVLTTVMTWHRAAAAVPEFQPATQPVIAIPEFGTTATSVVLVTCADADEDVVKISLASVTPTTGSCATCFQVYPEATAGVYQLTYLPKGTLSFDDQRDYRLSLSCVNLLTPRETAVNNFQVEVRLRPNTPPTFSGQRAISVDRAKNLKDGDAVSTTTNTRCNDIDGDSLVYTMTTVPDSASNFFEINGATGQIFASTDIAGFCRSSVTFQVTCQDPFNGAVGPTSVQATLNGANTVPSITGLNFVRDVTESTPAGTTIATFTITDDDTPSCLLATSPLESLKYFELDNFPTGTTRAIRLKRMLNYEDFTSRNTNVTVTCRDTFCTSPPSFLFVRTSDVNEAVELFPKHILLSAYEGQITLDPQWRVLDQDENDPPAYSIVSGNTNGNFAINPTTGVITSSLEYDVDGNAMPSTDFLVVRVVDAGMHSSTATVSLTILDRNDNRPIFTTAGTQTISITDCATTLGRIGTVSATDRDSDFQGNNAIRYIGSGAPISVGANGDIFASTGVTAGATYIVEVTATDAGQFPNQLSSSTRATVTVVVTACPVTVAPTVASTAAPVTTAAATTAAVTVAPTTSGSGSGSGSGTNTGAAVVVAPNTSSTLDTNLGWIVVAGLLGTAFLAALAYMLWRYCFPNIGNISAGCQGLFGSCDCCQSRQPPPRPRMRELSPSPPPPREFRRTIKGNPPKPGNNQFWQERYPDDDYNVQPNRERIPSPANMDGRAPWRETDQVNHSWRARALHE